MDAQRRSFFVFIVESPSAPDLYHGRHEGFLLQQALALESLPSVTRIAISKEAFKAALTIGITDEMKRFSQLYPIIHISAHGSQDGLQLSNGENILWNELRDLLLPLNKALQGGLLLCMSSCEGFSACQMAMLFEPGDQPFWGIVGHKGKPGWADTAVAYATFYHLLIKGSSIADAVKAMGVAAGDAGFTEITAEQARLLFIEHVNQINLAQAQQTMQRQADAVPSSPLTKALENH